MDIFNPLIAPTMGTEASFKARVISNKFGDAYRQTGPDGLNAVAATIPLSWPAVSLDQAAYMHAFFVAHVGKPFLYMIPRESVYRVFDCEDWTHSWPAGGFDGFKATFMERFDLA